MQLFYCPNLEGPSATLDSEESRHAVRVLRMSVGSEIWVADGRGTLCRATIAAADPTACLITIDQTLPQQPRPALTLAVAPTKNPSRMEWMVEKTVETGLAALVLLQCDHSERTSAKTDRLGRIALSAMKQSLHTQLPLIEGPLPFGQWLATLPPQEPHHLRLIAHCDSQTPRRPIATALAPGLDATILIGPEGDFSTTEIEAALGAGFQPVSLGHARLRTETAALYAACAFNIANDSQL
ncbi:MAG: 16S rRNA (uracil(1498)-N(3))-methyltransferase [Bacteroidales bacterium]|nr:16S rRNA (uracil(1498)-N(3))-methyltransferase [Bacteroidales bacterium]